MKYEIYIDGEYATVSGGDSPAGAVQTYIWRRYSGMDMCAVQTTPSGAVSIPVDYSPDGDTYEAEPVDGGPRVPVELVREDE